MTEFFDLRNQGTDVRREVLAGATTFVSVMYIIVVNPAILQAAGMPFATSLTATVLASAFSSILMGLYTNNPLVVAPGMSLNSLFALAVAKGAGVDYATALGCVFWAGVIFLLLMTVDRKRRIITGVPRMLRLGIAGGIGLFIALLGLRSGCLRHRPHPGRRRSIPLPGHGRRSRAESIAPGRGIHFTMFPQEALDAGAHKVLRGEGETSLPPLIADKGGSYDAFALPRYNYLGEQVMLGGGRYPDYQIRLFKQGSVLWPDAHHTPPVVTTGPARLWEVTHHRGPHIHHRNYRDLRQLISRQLDYALTDVYPGDPASFDFAAYLARAHQQMALRSEPETDGDLSQAMALVMAWDAVMRGLIHWDSLEPRPPLNMLEAFPRTAAQAPCWEIRLHRYLGRHLALRRLLKAVLTRLRALLPKRG